MLRHFALEKGTGTLFVEGEHSTLNAQRATFKVQPRGWAGRQSGIEWRCQARYLGARGLRMAVPGSLSNGGVRLVIWFALEKGTDTLFGEGERSTLNAQRATLKVQPRGRVGPQSGIEWRCQARDLGARGLRMAVSGSLSNGGVRLVIWFALEKGTDTLFGEGERSTLNAQRATLKVQPRGWVGPQSGIEWRCQARYLGARGLRMAVSGSLSGLRSKRGQTRCLGMENVQRLTRNAQRSKFNLGDGLGRSPGSNGGARLAIWAPAGCEWRCQARHRMAVSGSLSNGGARLVIWAPAGCEWRCQARYLVRSKREQGTGTLIAKKRVGANEIRGEGLRGEARTLDNSLLPWTQFSPRAHSKTFWPGVRKNGTLCP